MKRLLAVSWAMPPMYGPRATQVSRTLRQLAALGWRPIAVCLAPRPRGRYQVNGRAADSLQGIDLVRVASPEEWLVLRAAWHLAPALGNFPDRSRVWVARATQAALRALAPSDCAGLITFGQPWSDHLVGLRVHRALGCGWVAHFSDPWADSPYATSRQREIWRPMEERVIREATSVVFVTAETANLVMNKYPPAWREKVSVVSHGFDLHRRAVEASAVLHDRPLRIVYTGRFYAGLRTPVPVLRALADLNGREGLAGVLEIRFVGPGVDEFERDAIALGVRALVRFDDRVPPDRAAEVAAEADVLLVIDAPSQGPSVFLPSRLIDYLPFRKPILGVTPEPGASAALLRRLGCPVAPPEDVGAVALALADLVRRWRNGSLSVGDAFDRVAAEFEIGRTTRQLHDVLIRAFTPPQQS